MKFTLVAATPIEIIQFEGESYLKYGTVSRTSSGGTDLNFVNAKGTFIKDAHITRYSTGTTAMTLQFAYSTELELDPKSAISRYDGAVYYKPVGSRPPC